MSAIGPGDFVECVESYFGNPVVGRVYRCVTVERGQARGCALHASCDGAVSVVVGGLQTRWCPRQFRPIYRPQDSLIEQLKQPVSEPA